jgi:hypothetical protein
MHDEWYKFKSMTVFSTIRPIEIDINLPNNSDIVKKYNIEMVPQLIKITNNGSDTYDGERTAENIYTWAASP